MCIYNGCGGVCVYIRSVEVCIMSVGVIQGHMCIYNKCGGVCVYIRSGGVYMYI